MTIEGWAAKVARRFRIPASPAPDILQLRPGRFAPRAWQLQRAPESRMECSPSWGLQMTSSQTFAQR